MRADVVIGKIKEVQQAAALQSLTQPNGTTEFHYGAACGVQKGLDLALQVITKDEEDARKLEAGNNG